MPQPMNEPDENTLPDPELNPLLNPLLAAHMGRLERFEALSELPRQAIALNGEVGDEAMGIDDVEGDFFI